MLNILTHYPLVVWTSPCLWTVRDNPNVVVHSSWSFEFLHLFLGRRLPAPHALLGRLSNPLLSSRRCHGNRLRRLHFRPLNSAMGDDDDEKLKKRILRGRNDPTRLFFHFFYYEDLDKKASFIDVNVPNHLFISCLEL